MEGSGPGGIVGALLEERVLVLTPLGRDATVAAALLTEGGLAPFICPTLFALKEALDEGAGLAMITQEALRTADLTPLVDWLQHQPAWSDLPIIVITERGVGQDHNHEALRLIEALGNVTLLERPFQPFTLISCTCTALRSRRRQYQARAQLEELADRQLALQLGEERFRMLADNIPVLAWTAQADGSIVWYNSRWYEYTGTTPAEMEGWGWQSVHDAALLPMVLERWRGAIAARTHFEMVFPLRGADGVMRPFLTRVAPVIDADGVVIRWFGTNVDISAERAAEAEVRASEERLRFVLAAGQLGAWELDISQDHWSCSDICQSHFGLQPAALFTSSELLDCVHGEDRARLSGLIAQACAGSGSSDGVACRVPMPDGQARWVELRGRLVQAADGHARFAGVSLDITDRKQAEAELRRHRERLEEMVQERTRDLAQAIDQLHDEVLQREQTEAALRQSQKMEAIGQLTGGIAHDFNNLLTGIAGCMEVMQTRLGQGRTTGLDRYITAASESVTRAAALTHRLLAFARRQTLERKPLDPNRLVLGMEELIQRTVGPAIAVRLDLAADAWLALCDLNQLESALLNLCINAKDAMPSGGTLTIGTANLALEAGGGMAGDLPAGQYVRLTVTDTGVGMSPQTVASAFEPFFTTKPLGQGTGLGLSMVYGFVRQSGGQVRIHSTPGRGTSLLIYLPRFAGPAPLHEEPAPAVAAAASGAAGKSILVVEDEAVIRDLITETLVQAGYRVVAASDGPAGLKLIEADDGFDMLLTDVGLPGLNGRQLADAARVRRPDQKVLFITGYAHNAAAGDLLDGNMHMITKPFALDTLRTKVGSMFLP